MIQNQAIIKLSPGTNDVNWLNRTYIGLNNTIPMFFFGNTSSDNTYVFSFRFHRALRTSNAETDFPYQIENDPKTLEFFDLMITGNRGTHLLNYGVLIVKDSKFHCSFVPLPQQINLKMVYENFYSSAFIVLISLFVLFGLALRVCIFCCQSRMVNEKLEPLSAKFKYDNPLLDFLYSFYAMPDKDAIQFIGSEAYYFMRFTRTLIVCMFGFSIVGIGLIFLDAFSPPNSLNSQDITKISIAVLNPGGWGLQTLSIIGHFFALIFYLVIAFGCNIFLFYISKSVIKKEDIIPKQTLTFSNVPRDIVDKEIFLKFFTDQSEDVVSLHLAYDVSGVSKEYEELNRLKQIEEINDLKTKKYQFWKWTKEELDEKISQLKEKIGNHPKIGSGFIFVSFTTVEMARSFIERFKSKTYKGHSEELKTKEWRVKKSPKSANIIWENLSYGMLSQIIRRVIGNIILMTGYILAALFLLFLFGTTTLRDYTKNIFIKNFHLLSSSFQQFLTGLNAFLDLTPLWIILMVLVIVPTLLIIVSISKYHTKTEEKRAQAILLLIFLFVCTLILPRFIKTIVGLSVAFQAKAPFNTYDYLFIDLIPELLLTVTLIPLLFKTIESFFTFLFILFSLCKCRIIKPKFNSAFNYANNICVFLSILYYGTMIPILPVFGFIFFIYNYTNDKFMILYFYQKSDELDGSFFKNLIRSFIFYILIAPFFVMTLLSRFQGVSFVLFLILFFVVNPILYIGFMIITRKKPKNSENFIMNEEKIKTYYESPYDIYLFKNEPKLN